MKSLITLLLVAAIASPSAVFAQSWVADIISSAQSGNGTVVESHSSASSGGQSASSGQTVSTGDVSASSHVETHINSNNSGGTVQVKVEKTENGVTTKEEYTKPVGVGEAVNVNVEVKASSGGVESAKTKVDVRGWDPKEKQEAAESTSTEAVDGTSVSTSIETETEIKAFFSEKVPSFFKKVFSFIWWF